MLCFAQTMLLQDVALSVCLSVRLSHAGILSKQLNIIKLFSPSRSHTIHFFRNKLHGNIPRGETPLTGAPNAGGIFGQHVTLSRK